MKRRSRIVFAGFLVRNPLGGYFWQTAHYLVGLQSLGHEVWFYEDTSGYQFAYNPMGDETGYSYGYGLEAVARFFGRIGFAHSWVFVDTQSGRSMGHAPDDPSLFCGRPTSWWISAR